MPNEPIKQGYKLTEIGIIPNDWEVKILGKTATLKARIGWQGLTKSEYLKIGNYYLITGTDFKNGLIDFDNCIFVEKLRYDQDKNIQLKKSDILVTKDGTIGKVALVKNLNKPATLNSGIFVIRPIDNNFNPTFFYYLLCSNLFTIFLNQLSAGSTINHLYQKDFVNFIYYCPPIAQQEKIAEVLTDIDELIESLEELINKKRLIKQGAMQELLTGKRRLKGFGEQWKLARLGDVANIYRGASPRPIDSPIWFDNSSKIGWVRISDITKSRSTLKQTTQYLSELGIKNSRFVKSGSLIMSICATVGRAIITEIDLCIHDGFVVFDSPDIDQNFLYHYLKYIEPKWSQHGQTGSQMNLNTDLLNRTEIPLPPTKEEQGAIASILTDMDREIEGLEEKLEKYRQIKQGMMEELLTGKIRL